ncbi:MAG: hypothetical protein A3F54_03875 [Candidatus Kerfeldbacteria bacterium RIFCSPHIGHO2_12_FULL_48_17]|uniref:Ribonuclease J n=1 Tax=Candidatus Kerfeldbacteria bacterium RIFCSPHIGHO2_12_FULL_48_17 TaxID=1798542 RepID=A0A1G2B7X9_9BACT|nr:MAG: hypothetical protein A3F54_03875 [Candidatus Kerfeldbacteria bacterium RIFCSPHIGHO2_12_FULL_48_17]
MARSPRVAPHGDRLRIIVLGGAEEVGRNCTLLEYGNDIIIIDLGLQFPEEEHPGVDYIIPNMNYLKGKERNVRGVIITHGHYDHIGAIPQIMPQIGNPPIYGTKLTLAIIKKRQEDYPDKGKLNLRVIDDTTVLRLGKFTVRFYRVNHNIPDCVSVVVETPEGSVIHTGDFKFDYTPVMDKPIDLVEMAQYGARGVLALLSDSTNVFKAGHQKSESDIGEQMRGIFSKSKGRVIVGTFASLLSRVQQVIWLAEEFNRHVVIEGFSMRTNVEITKKFGYLQFKERTIVSPEEAQRLPASKLVIMCTGAQGEDNAALMRIAMREHKRWRIEKGDSVIFSSSVIPGNERSVQKLRDTLVREGAKIYHTDMMDIHAGGHIMAEDLKLLMRLLKPKYLMPIEGNHFMLRAAEEVALTIGHPQENILITTNGQVVEFRGGKGVVTKERVDSDHVFVDGLGVGDVSQVVLRDRQLMADDGMVVIIATVKERTAELVGSPDIISRGFVYMKGSKDLIEEVRSRVRLILKSKSPDAVANDMYLKNKIRDEIGQFLFQKTERRPMVLPVVIQV